MGLFGKSHDEKVSIAYKGFNPEMVGMVFPGGREQANIIVKSLAKIYELKLNVCDAKTYFDILSSYSTVVIRRVVSNSEDKQIVEILLEKYSNLIKSKATARRAIAYVDLNMKNNEFALETEKDFFSLDLLAGTFSSYQQIADENADAELDNLDDPEYGLVPEKPIFTRRVAGSNEYLENLVSSSGEELKWKRRGSRSVNGVNGIVDIYDSTLSSGEAYKTIYINMYGSSNSTKIPAGFSRVKSSHSSIINEYEVNPDKETKKSIDEEDKEKERIEIQSNEPDAPAEISAERNIVTENKKINSPEEINELNNAGHMFCRKCGKKIPADSGFCQYCGTKVILEDDNVVINLLEEQNRQPIISSQTKENSITEEKRLAWENTTDQTLQQEGKKVKHKGGIIVFALSVIIALIAIFAISAINKGTFMSDAEKYELANVFIDNREYNIAYTILDTISDKSYEYTDYLITKCCDAGAVKVSDNLRKYANSDEFSKEKKYSLAVENFEKGNYKEASQLFSELDTYLDSNVKAKYCDYCIKNPRLGVYCTYAYSADYSRSIDIESIKFSVYNRINLLRFDMARKLISESNLGVKDAEQLKQEVIEAIFMRYSINLDDYLAKYPRKPGCDIISEGNTLSHEDYIEGEYTVPAEETEGLQYLYEEKFEKARDSFKAGINYGNCEAYYHICEDILLQK